MFPLIKLEENLALSCAMNISSNKLDNSEYLCAFWSSRKDLQLKAGSIFCELAKGDWLPTKSIYLYCLCLSLQLMVFLTLTLLISFTGP